MIRYLVSFSGKDLLFWEAGSAGVCTVHLYFTVVARRVNAGFMFSKGMLLLKYYITSFESLCLRILAIINFCASSVSEWWSNVAFRFLDQAIVMIYIAALVSCRLCLHSTVNFLPYTNLIIFQSSSIPSGCRAVHSTNWKDVRLLIHCNTNVCKFSKSCNTG